MVKGPIETINPTIPTYAGDFIMRMDPARVARHIDTVEKLRDKLMLTLTSMFQNQRERGFAMWPVADAGMQFKMEILGPYLMYVQMTCGQKEFNFFTTTRNLNDRLKKLLHRTS